MDQTPTHLDLFSGIGGFVLAAQWAGFRTVGFCEIDKYCRKVLAKNFMADTDCATITTQDNGRTKHSQERPEMGQINSSSRPRLFGNIFDLDGTTFRGVTLVTGGFPCQPFSVAGKRGGAADDRAIWPEMFRVISEARPAFVLGENVPGIISMELDNVLSDLERIGYATRSFVIPACAVDARHRRDRLWIVGRNVCNSEHSGCDAPEKCRGIGAGSNDSKAESQQACEPTGSSKQHPELAIAECRNGQECWIRSGTLQNQGRKTSDRFGNGSEVRPARWLPEPDVGRVAHGIPSRVDRLKGIGNAIVPQVAFEILREIRKLI